MTTNTRRMDTNTAATDFTRLTAALFVTAGGCLLAWWAGQWLAFAELAVSQVLPYPFNAWQFLIHAGNAITWAGCGLAVGLGMRLLGFRWGLVWALAGVWLVCGFLWWWPGAYAPRALINLGAQLQGHREFHVGPLFAGVLTGLLLYRAGLGGRAAALAAAGIAGARVFVGLTPVEAAIPPLGTSTVANGAAYGLIVGAALVGAAALSQGRPEERSPLRQMIANSPAIRWLRSRDEGGSTRTFWVLAAAALIVGIVGTVFIAQLDLFSAAALRFENEVVAAALILGLTVYASLLAVLASRTVPQSESDQMRVLAVTGISARELAWGYTLRALKRLRHWLLPLIAIFPPGAFLVSIPLIFNIGWPRGALLSVAVRPLALLAAVVGAVLSAAAAGVVAGMRWRGSPAGVMVPAALILLVGIGLTFTLFGSAPPGAGSYQVQSAFVARVGQFRYISALAGWLITDMLLLLTPFALFDGVGRT